MILEVADDQIALLNDADLRTLVAYLCEREVRAHGYSPSSITWGGHQNAGDGGIDVRVALPVDAVISGYVPKAAVGFQVKAQDMPRAAILEEMAPGGVVLPSIAELAAHGGAYIIVSSMGSLSDSSLRNRKSAMIEAVRGLPSGTPLTVDFYDRRRIASWVNQHAGLIPWVREKLGLPLFGWRPFEDWSSSPAAVDAPYLLDAQTRLVGPSISDVDGLNAEQALANLRDILSKSKGVVRLVGLSGVGKTRLIQALFDDRIGIKALPWSDALYADISDDPSPVPQEMLSRLIGMSHRVVLIVDNCGIDLHRKLATKIANSDCLLSLITVEYDINDDEPPNTNIFRMEPASPDLIEKMLESRYPSIAAPSRHVIARFSEGNSRVAFALADTAKNGESLAKLNDTDLFERLFHQQKESSAELLDAAKTCALLFSFDGETLDGDPSELLPLAKLAEQSVDQLHKHVAELYRRQLVQKRGKWRAILPHALANRLAKRGLEDIPLQRIEEFIVNGPSARTLRSFSRRIGYLHGDERATALVGKWWAAGGLLEKLGQFNTLGAAVFENIAPVDPPATLAFIEKIALRNEDQFFGKQNENKTQIVRVLRSLAYDSTLFERSARLMQGFVLGEESGTRDSVIEPLKSLFWLHLSGTHASIAQRVSFIKTLLEHDSTAKQDLGLKLMGEMLETSNFTSHYSFEFGAWKRDYGSSPEDGAEVKNWYTQVIEMACIAEASDIGLSDRVRRVMANHISELLRAGMLDEITALAKKFTESRGWAEGWIGVRKFIRRSKDEIPEEILKKSEELERHLRPADLAEMIRSYALPPAWGALDIADLDDDKVDPLGAQQRVLELCDELGVQLAGNTQQFDALIVEIITSDSQKTFALGQGLAKGCSSLVACWSRLQEEFLKIPEGQRKEQLLSGFLASAMLRSSSDTNTLLDEVLADSRFHPYMIYWQVSAGIADQAFERMMKALQTDTVPIQTFSLLASGRAHEGMDDDQFRLLLRGILAKDGGNETAAYILGMRVFGRLADNLPISDSLKETSREFLVKTELRSGERRGFMIGKVIEAAFDRSEYEDQARTFCARIIAAVKTWDVYASDLHEIVTALTKTFPIAVLDIFVEQMANENGAGRPFFQEIRGRGRCPLNTVPDEVWMSWAAQKPETRYELLAQVVRFSTADDDEHVNGWSPTAIKLIEAAPAPVTVLNSFFQRFRPNGWAGSLADTLATRLPLFDALKQHPKAEIAAWANARVPEFAAYIERQRAQEAKEDNARDQTFE